MSDVVQNLSDAIEHISEVGNAMSQNAQDNMHVIQTTQDISKEIDEIAQNIKKEMERKKV